MEARANAAVSDRGYRLVFETDRLRNLITETTLAAREMEHRLRCEIRETVSAEIDLLRKDLTATKGRFGEYRGDLLAGVKQELTRLRGSMIQKMTKMGTANLTLHRMAKKLAEDEEGDMEGR